MAYADRVVLISVPGLAPDDLSRMPALKDLLAAGDEAVLAPSFPCLAGTVLANMLTGLTPDEHGLVGECYLSDRGTIQRAPAWPRQLDRPQICDVLRDHRPDVRAAIISPSGADVAGQGGNRQGDDDGLAWILQASLRAASQQHPELLMMQFDHIDRTAQWAGLDSGPLHAAQAATDDCLKELAAGLRAIDGPQEFLWLVASGYANQPVGQVCYPNRLLRDAGLLCCTSDDTAIDIARSRAVAVTNLQMSHVYVTPADPTTVRDVANVFRNQAGIAEVLLRDELDVYDLRHARSGDIVLVSTADSWQACDWWPAGAAPSGQAGGAHDPLKPGCDPCELLPPALHRDTADAGRIRASHGAPARLAAQRGVIWSSQAGVLPGGILADTDVCGLVLRQYGV